MIAVITGDIINSRKVSSKDWLPQLKSYFLKITKDSKKYEIYRGDSFQVEVPAERALEVAVCIKALIKSNNTINVRMSIGLGDKKFKGRKITESNGSAFINSGDGFERLKGNKLIIKSENDEFDAYFNPILKLVNFIADSWKPVTAETILFAISNRKLLQREIAKRLDKDSTTVNKALKRGAFDEIEEVLNLFKSKVVQWQN